MWLSYFFVLILLPLSFLFLLLLLFLLRLLFLFLLLLLLLLFLLLLSFVLFLFLTLQLLLVLLFLLFLLHNFFLDNLLLQLHFKILNLINIRNHILKPKLPAFKVLFNFLSVLLHPAHQLSFSLCLLFHLLILQQLFIIIFTIAVVLLIYTCSYLSSSSLRSYWYFSLVDIFDSRKIFGCSEISVPTETRYLSALSIVHLGVLDSPIVVTSQLLDPDLPIVQLPQQPVNLIIQSSDLILRSSPVLDLLDFLYNVRSDLLAPSLTFVEIRDITDLAETFRTLVILTVYQGAFHRPPTIQHALGFLAVAGHFIRGK